MAGVLGSIDDVVENVDAAGSDGKNEKGPSNFEEIAFGEEKARKK